jgi:hypothetical protein
MKKLIPTYEKKLDNLLIYNGRARGLSSWRKEFKKVWRKCEKTSIRDPDDPKYAPDPSRWVCTCPSFVKSRFLICKHLVQGVHPISPRFFQQASHYRTTPFWQHPDLQPLLVAMNSTANHERTQDIEVEFDGDGDYEIDEEDCGYILTSQTFDERLDQRIAMMHDFIGALEHQRQFRDTRFLAQLEQRGTSFFHFIEECQELERRTNSSRLPLPNTWGKGNVMFFRTRPLTREKST